MIVVGIEGCPGGGRCRAMGSPSTLIGHDIPPDRPPPDSKDVESLVFMGARPEIRERKPAEDGIRQQCSWWDVASCLCDDTVADEEAVVLF